MRRGYPGPGPNTVEKRGPYGAYWVPGGGAPPPRRPQPPGLTPDQWAAMQADKIVAAQVASIKAQQDAYMAELQRQAQLRIQQGQAMATWLRGQNFPGQIQGLYQNAGRDVAGYAQGFAGDVRDIASGQAAEVNNMLSGSGQTARNEGTGMGDVLYGAYGYGPAKSLAEGGAALASNAALQPNFAAQIGIAEAEKARNQGLTNLVEFAKMIAEAKGQKPQLQLELAGQRQQFAAQKAATERQNREDRRKWFLQMAAYYNQIGDDKRSEQYLRLAQQRAVSSTNKSKGLDADGNLLPGFHYEGNKIVKDGWHLNNKDKAVKDKTSGSSGTKPADWGKVQSSMADETLTVKAVDPAKPWLGYQEIPMTRKQAYQFLWAKYSGLIKDKGRLRRLINQILDLKGIPKTPAGG